MIELLIKILSSLNSWASPQRIKDIKRSKLAKPLKELYLKTNEIVEIGYKLLDSDFEEGDLVYSINSKNIEKHAENLKDISELIQKPPFSDIMSIYFPDIDKIKGLITSKTESISFLLSNLYGFLDSEIALEEFNKLWKIMQLENYSDLDPEDVYQLPTDLDEDIELAEAIRYNEEEYIDGKLFAIHATPEHSKYLKVNLDKLKEANFKLRDFITEKFEPEELM